MDARPAATIPFDQLRLSEADIPRNADRRAAFGQFCLNAASFPLPAAVENRVADGYRIDFIQRTFPGLGRVSINAFAEHCSSADSNDIWAAGAATVRALSERRPDIIKLFIAGAVGSRSDEARLIAGTGGTAYWGVFLPFDEPEVLEFGGSYEQFLSTLGRHTRRDMRRLRRKAAGNRFRFEFFSRVPGNVSERHALGMRAHPKRYGSRRIDAYDRFLAAQKSVFYTTLRDASGELVSCCAGLIADGAATLLYQLNDRNYADASLSLTHRSYLIEHLIAQGIAELILPGGGSGLLTHACRGRANGELILVRRSLPALLRAIMVTALRPNTSSVALGFRRLLREWI